MWSCAIFRFSECPRWVPQESIISAFLHLVRSKNVGSSYLQAKEAFEILLLCTHLPDFWVYWTISTIRYILLSAMIVNQNSCLKGRSQMWALLLDSRESTQEQTTVYYNFASHVAN